MSLNIPFETALIILITAYLASGLLVLAATNAAIAVIETLEEIGN